MGLWWLKIEWPSVCYSGGGPQFTVQIHRILAGGVEDLASGTGCKAYVHKWWICRWLRPWFPELEPDNRICMVIFSFSDTRPREGVRRVILRVTLRLLHCAQVKTLQSCGSTTPAASWSTHHIFKAPAAVCMGFQWCDLKWSAVICVWSETVKFIWTAIVNPRTATAALCIWTPEMTHRKYNRNNIFFVQQCTVTYFSTLLEHLLNVLIIGNCDPLLSSMLICFL